MYIYIVAPERGVVYVKSLQVLTILVYKADCLMSSNYREAYQYLMANKSFAGAKMTPSCEVQDTPYEVFCIAFDVHVIVCVFMCVIGVYVQQLAYLRIYIHVHALDYICVYIHGYKCKQVHTC